MVATLALGTKVGGALCLSGIRPDQCVVLERLYAPCTARRLAVPSRPATPSPRRSRASPVDVRADYDVAEKTFRDPDDFGKEYWGSWARLVLTRKDADRRELLERISEDAVLG